MNLIVKAIVMGIVLWVCVMMIGVALTGCKSSNPNSDVNQIDYPSADPSVTGQFHFDK